MIIVDIPLKPKSTTYKTGASVNVQIITKICSSKQKLKSLTLKAGGHMITRKWRRKKCLMITVEKFQNITKIPNIPNSP